MTRKKFLFEANEQWVAWLDELRGDTSRNAFIARAVEAYAATLEHEPPPVRAVKPVGISNSTLNAWMDEPQPVKFAQMLAANEIKPAEHLRGNGWIPETCRHCGSTDIYIERNTDDGPWCWCGSCHRWLG